MSAREITLVVDPVELTNIQTAKKEAEDLAWEHAKASSAASFHDLGSEEFTEQFEMLRENYDFAADHLYYLTHCSLLIVMSLLQSGAVRLSVPLDEQVLDNLNDGIRRLARVTTAGLIHAFSASDGLWIQNERMERMEPMSRSVKFHLAIDGQINNEKGGNAE